MYRSNGKLYKADAIILSRKNYGEADRIITVFTRQYGKLHLLAKGVRKTASRRGPHLEIFSRVQFLIRRGSGMDTISDVDPIDVFEHIRTDLSRVGVAFFYCELIIKLLADGQDHTDVYDLCIDALESLNTDTESTRYIQSREFTLELLWFLGFLPRSKRLTGIKLQEFIENITEHSLATPKMVRRLI